VKVQSGRWAEPQSVVGLGADDVRVGSKNTVGVGVSVGVGVIVGLGVGDGVMLGVGVEVDGG
jgi:hypothetical protein